jgi:dipeptidyl aminopeptidase/acylaminoacyl peptidase
VRHNAAKYEIKPDKFGICGASAGGHLSLTMATQGKPGDPNAKDPIDRESSAVQAAACFFPPTDFLNYGKDGEDAVGVGILKDYKNAFGPRSETADERKIYGKEISPIYFLTKDSAPCLIIHGDADKLVPIQQAQIFIDKAKSLGVPARLVTRPGQQHGWPKIEEDVPLLADWFDQYLRGIEPRQ